MPIRHFVIVLLAAMTASTAVAEPAAAVRMTFENLLGEGKDAIIHAHLTRDGKLAGWAETPTFNRGVHAVDLNRLKLDGGEVTFTIASDGYVPKRGTTLKMDARVFGGNYLSRVDGEDRGGKVTVERVAQFADEAVYRVELHGESLVNLDRKPGKSRRLGLNLTFDGGKLVAARAIPPGSLTDVGFEAIVTGSEGQLRNGRFQGMVDVTLLPQSKKPTKKYCYTIDARAVGERVGGTVEVTQDGKAVGEGSVRGDVRHGDPPGADDALHTLVLHDAIPGNFLVLYLNAREGKFTHGFATGPNYNNATHTVDISQLRVTGDRISGEVDVTVNPDPWVPRDGSKTDARYDINAKFSRGAINGQFTGRFGKQQVKGNVEGQLDARPDVPGIDKITFKLEKALFGDGGYHSRCFLTIDVNDGKAVSGRVWNNHSNLRGTITGGDITVKNDRLVAKITADVEQSGGVTAGKYRFKIEGGVVGTSAAGSFTTTWDKSDRTETDRFWASFKTTND